MNMNMPQFSALFMVASSTAAVLFTLGLGGTSVSMPDTAPTEGLHRVSLT
jgi:hypothetical protein